MCIIVNSWHIVFSSYRIIKKIYGHLFTLFLYFLPFLEKGIHSSNETVYANICTQFVLVYIYSTYANFGCFFHFYFSTVCHHISGSLNVTELGGTNHFHGYLKLICNRAEVVLEAVANPDLLW